MSQATLVHLCRLAVFLLGCGVYGVCCFLACLGGCLGLVCPRIFLFPVSLCFFGSFTDWCTAHRQQFREQKKELVSFSSFLTDKLCGWQPTTG